MISIDSDVLIDYSRTRDAHLHGLFLIHPIVVCGIDWAEVLSGARTPDERSVAVKLLASFSQVSIPDSLWIKVGDARALLLSKGLSVPFNDIVLAVLAIDQDYEFWSRD